MRYNLQYLEEMRLVPNVGMIIEQIDYAASLTSEEMRRYGIALPSEIPGEPNKVPRSVPLKSEVDTYLRFLVADAFVGFQLTREAALSDGSVVLSNGNSTIPDWEIEGLPSTDDPIFDVVVTGLQDSPAGFLTARISRRLTG